MCVLHYQQLSGVRYLNQMFFILNHILYGRRRGRMVMREAKYAENCGHLRIPREPRACDSRRPAGKPIENIYNSTYYIYIHAINNLPTAKRWTNIRLDHTIFILKIFNWFSYNMILYFSTLEQIIT